MKQRLSAWWQLMRGPRPIGFILLALPAAWSLLLAAEGRPPLHLLLIFIAGAFLVRSAGCVINDYADRDIDGQVKRTRERPLVTGAATPQEALGLFAALLGAAFILVLFTNPLTVLLAIPGALLAALYPFAKRFTDFPQAVLGAAFAWGVPMAFAAVNGEVPAEAWLIYLATLLWTAAYDTFYAMADREDDIRIGVRSSAILLGRADLLGIALMQAGALALLLLAGVQFELGAWYRAGLALAALLFAWQHYMARRREPEKCFAAFIHNQWVGVAVMLGIALDYYVGNSG